MENSNRRDFMKKSTLFGTGLMMVNPFNITANPLKAADKVNIAVVGFVDEFVRFTKTNQIGNDNSVSCFNECRHHFSIEIAPSWKAMQ